MEKEKYKKITEAQRKILKSMGTVDCFVCKDSKNHIYGNKGGKYSELIA